MLLEFVRRLLPVGSFRRHAAALSAASVLAQLAQVAFTPILTRLYSPAAFGEWALIMALAYVANALGGGRYELAIMMAPSDKESHAVAVVHFLCNVGTCVVLAMAIYLFSEHLANRVEGGHLSKWFYAAPFVSFWMVLGAGSHYYLLRKKAFFSLSGYRIALAVTTALTPILVYPISNGEAFGLLLGSALGPCCILLFLVGPAKRIIKTHLADPIGAGDIWGAAVRYRKFPLFTVPYGFATELRERGSLFVLSSCATAAVVGYYSQVMRVLYMPIGLIASSLNAAILQRAAGAAESRQRTEMLLARVLSTLAVLLVPGYVWVGFFGSDIFGFVLGTQWRDAGQYAALLALPCFTVLLVGCTDKMLDLVERQGLVLAVELAYSSVALVAMAAGYVVWGDPRLAVGMFSGAVFVGHCARLYALYRCWRFSVMVLLKIAWMALAEAAICGVFCWVSELALREYYFVPLGVTFFGACVIGGVAYRFSLASEGKDGVVVGCGWRDGAAEHRICEVPAESASGRVR